MVLLKENSHQKLQNPDSDLNPEPALILFMMGEVFQLQHLTVTFIDDYVTTAYIPECITQVSNQFTLQNASRKALTLLPQRLYHTIILNDCVVHKSIKFYTNMCKI